MHRHRIRAFVTTTGETDVPVAIFAEGQFLRFVGGAVRTFGLGPGTTTINALATWGDTTGTQLLNTSTLLDSSGHMTQLVTLDGQDAPNITAKIGTDPVLQEVTVWASTAAPWKLGRSGVKINPGGDMTDVTTLNGRSPGILVGRSPTSSPSTNSVMVSADGTGIVARGTPVLVDPSGNVTGVTSINGTTPGTWVQGPASASDLAIALFDGTTGKLIRNSAVFIAATQIYGLTLIRSIGVSEHGLGGSLPTDILNQINEMNVGYTTISNVTALDGVDPLTWVVGPASSTDTRIALFNGSTGKLIKQSVVAIGSGGAITGVTSINGTDPSTWMVGAASSTVNRLVTFGDSTGKLASNAATVTAAGGALAGVTTINTTDPATWVVGPSSATSGGLASFSGTTGKIISDSGITTAYIQRGQSTIIGPLTITSGGFTGSGGFVPGYGFAKRASAYHVAFSCDIPVSFPDTSVTLTFSVSSSDNVGQWQIHTPNSSATVALGSSGTFVNGTPTAFAVASFHVAVGITVPAGSGYHDLFIQISSSGASANFEAYGIQYWFEAGKL